LAAEVECHFSVLSDLGTLMLGVSRCQDAVCCSFKTLLSSKHYKQVVNLKLAFVVGFCPTDCGENVYSEILISRVSPCLAFLASG
jgi:hypothetical protein